MIQQSFLFSEMIVYPNSAVLDVCASNDYSLGIGEVSFWWYLEKYDFVFAVFIALLICILWIIEVSVCVWCTDQQVVPSIDAVPSSNNNIGYYKQGHQLLRQ